MLCLTVLPLAAQDASPSASQRQAIAAFQPLAASGVPQPPPGIAAAKAYAVLQAACARCHQAQRSDLPAPAGDLGNILDLDALAREPALITPAMPDASPLYTRMLDRHLPGDMFTGPHAGELTRTDVEAIRDWITELPRSARTCHRRQPIAAAELSELMEGWLEQMGPAAHQTRFISLAHLYNSCATDQELTAWREGVSKLLNSLSWAPLPARVETIGDKLALLAVKISDLGWVGAHWDRLAAQEPAGGAPPASEAVRRLSGTPHPVVRADWLASAASHPPLSHDLLGLPKRLADVGRIVGGDTVRPADPKRSMLIGASGETGSARVVERQETHNGALWLADDLLAPAVPVANAPAPAASGHAPGAANHAPAASLAPAAANQAPAAQAEGGTLRGPRKLLFNLPNGLLAFATFAADGSRIDATGAATACFACHAAGMVRPKPEATAATAPDAGGDAARGLPDDNFRYRRALVQAGVDPDRTTAGLEIITALARRYNLAVDLERAAGELATTPAELSARLEHVQGEARPLARRLLQGRLPWPLLERLLLALDGAELAPRPGPAIASDAPAPVDLGLWSDTPRHRKGQLVTFNVTTSAPCYLTLVNVDTAGRATVIFPNEFETDNAIAPGRVLRIPRDNAPYQLRLSKAGVEQAVAICNPSTRLPEGVTTDYERQRFSVLGNWRNFLAGEKAGINDDPRDLPRAPAQRRGRNGRQASKPEAPPAPPEPTAWAAISVIVD